MLYYKNIANKVFHDKIELEQAEIDKITIFSDGDAVVYLSVFTKEMIDYVQHFIDGSNLFVVNNGDIVYEFLNCKTDRLEITNVSPGENEVIKYTLVLDCEFVDRLLE
jgi:hypothetical protein